MTLNKLSRQLFRVFTLVTIAILNGYISSKGVLIAIKTYYYPTDAFCCNMFMWNQSTPWPMGTFWNCVKFCFFSNLNKIGWLRVIFNMYKNALDINKKLLKLLIISIMHFILKFIVAGNSYYPLNCCNSNMIGQKY